MSADDRAGVKVTPEPEIEAFYEADARRGWRVSAEYLRREQVLVNYSTHSMISDHAPGLGGDDTGPSPGELLLGGLAACTAVYLGRNARKLGIPLESARVFCRFEATHEAIDGPLPHLGFLDRVVKHVEVTGDLTEDQVAQLRFIAENCAIGETLRRGVDLVEDLVHVGGPAGAVTAAGSEPACVSGSVDGEECCAVDLDPDPGVGDRR